MITILSSYKQHPLVNISKKIISKNSETKQKLPLITDPGFSLQKIFYN